MDDILYLFYSSKISIWYFNAKPDSIFYFGLLALFIFIIYLIQSYTVVKYNGQSLYIKTIYRRITLNHFKLVKTWWSYDIGVSNSNSFEISTFATNVLSENPPERTRAHVNKINCYA